jgi:predicted RNase H-like HicB family nuclease
MKFLIVFEKTDTGYSAYLPDLPGCIATGKDKAAVENNIREAIEFHLKGIKEDGIPIDSPASFADYEEIAL